MAASDEPRVKIVVQTHPIDLLPTKGNRRFRVRCSMTTPEFLDELRVTMAGTPPTEQKNGATPPPPATVKGPLFLRVGKTTHVDPQETMGALYRQHTTDPPNETPLVVRVRNAKFSVPVELHLPMREKPSIHFLPRKADVSLLLVLARKLMERDLNAGESLCLFAGTEMPCVTANLGNLYAQQADTRGVLSVKISRENTFGA